MDSGDEDITLIASLLKLNCLNNDSTQAASTTYPAQGTTDATAQQMHNCKKGISQMTFWGKGKNQDTEGAADTVLEGVTGLQITCLGESTPSAVLGTDQNEAGDKLQKKSLTCSPSGQVVRGFSSSYFSEITSTGTVPMGWLDVGGLVCENPAADVITPVITQTENSGTIIAIVVGVLVLLILVIFIVAYTVKDPTENVDDLVKEGEIYSRSSSYNNGIVVSERDGSRVMVPIR